MGWRKDVHGYVECTVIYRYAGLWLGVLFTN